MLFKNVEYSNTIQIVPDTSWIFLNVSIEAGRATILKYSQNNR